MTKHAAATGIGFWKQLRLDIGNWARRVERKVLAGASATTIAGGATWALGRYVYHGQLPDGARSGIEWAATVLAGIVATYAAKHTVRPDAPNPVYVAQKVITATPAGLADPAAPGD